MRSDIDPRLVAWVMRQPTHEGNLIAHIKVEGRRGGVQVCLFVVVVVVGWVI